MARVRKGSRVRVPTENGMAFAVTAQDVEVEKGIGRRRKALHRFDVHKADRKGLPVKFPVGEGAVFEFFSGPSRR